MTAFQERLNELKPLWTRNLLLVFLPGLVLFVIGGPGGLLLPGGDAGHNLWLIVPGIVLCVIGFLRGAMLMYHYRRCPVCDAFQANEIRVPRYLCLRCGARLTNG